MRHFTFNGRNETHNKIFPYLCHQWALKRAKTFASSIERSRFKYGWQYFVPKNIHFCIYRIKCVALRVIHQYKFRRWVYLTDNCPALKIVQRILFMICIQWIDCVKAIYCQSQVSHYMSISLPIALHILYGSFCAVRMFDADLGIFYVYMWPLTPQPNQTYNKSGRHCNGFYLLSSYFTQ